MANPCSLHAFGVHIHGVQHSQILEIIRAYAFIEIVEQRAERVGKIGIPGDGSCPTNQRRPSAKHCGTGRPFNGMI